MERDENQGPTGGIVPHLTCDGAAAAIDFYKAAFGAVEHMRKLGDDSGKIMHAHLTFNGGTLMLHDDFPAMRGGGPLPAPAGVSMHLQVDDTDAWFDRAITAGATALMTPADMFWGDRYAQVRDPFGHIWAFGAPVKG